MDTEIQIQIADANESAPESVLMEGTRGCRPDVGQLNLSSTLLGFDSKRNKKIPSVPTFIRSGVGREREGGD